jgi:uncharacterized protein YbjT (DUF2867 family)
LVTTAGNVGSAAARLIAQRDVPVRVLVRHPENVAGLAQAGVEVFRGDLDSPESIDEAMQGASRVILVTQVVRSQQELSVIDSAERAGVEHLVKITTKTDAHSPIARRRVQSEIEDALVASGLSHTLLRNNAYMQNFLMMAAGIAQTSSFRTATGDGRIGHVDVRDVARRHRDRGVPGRPRRKDVLADRAGGTFGQRGGRDLHQGAWPTYHLSPHLL